MNISEFEYQELLRNMERKKGSLDPDTEKADPGKESILQGKIQKYCKDSGFPNL